MLKELGIVIGDYTKAGTYLKVCFQILWTLSMKNLLSISNTFGINMKVKKTEIQT